MTADAHPAPRVRVADTRRRPSPLVRRALGAVLASGAAVLLAATPAGAAATRIDTGADGNSVTAPMGVARTPDGALWVADSVRGICRIDESASPAAMVDSTWCQPGEDTRSGPVAPAGLAYDPVSSNFYVGDGASNFGGVWRLHYDAAGQTIDDASKIIVLADDRVEGVALGAGDLYYTTKRSPNVQRVTTPASIPGTPRTIGSAVDGAGSLTYLDGSLYLAEGNAVTRLDLSRPSSVAVPVPGLPGGLASAVVADPDRGRVYAATNNESGADQIDVLRVADGTVETYESGFAGISALGLETGVEGHAGHLLVGDDPMETVGAIDNAGYGRLWHVPLATLDRPAVRIAEAPAPHGQETAARFAYSSPVAGATFECRLDGAPWAACPGVGAGETTLTDLAEGSYVFELRARHPDPEIGAGNTVRRTFVVDRSAPSIWLKSPKDGDVLTFGPVAVDFAGDERGIEFACSVDGAPQASCDPVMTLGDLEPGEHTVRITGTDLAGNPAAAAESTFRVKSKPVLETQPNTPAPSGGGGSPATSTPAPTRPSTTAPSGQAQVLGVASSSRDDDASGLRAKSLRVRDRVVLRRNPRARASLRLDFAAPAGAYSARLTVRDFEEQRGVRVHATTRIPVESGRVHLRWLLTRAETRRLRAGRYRITVTIRNRRGTDGETVSGTLVVRSERR